MRYLSFKALHIIFIVTWFAALFYFPRLLVYHREASDRGDEGVQAQLLIMMRRLWWSIALPSAILTLFLGSYLFMQQPQIADWLWIKIIFVGLLYVYHFYLQRILLRLMHEKKHRLSVRQYRWLNEIPTLLLFAIVFLVVTKETDSWIVPCALIFILMTIFFVLQYLWKRKKNP